MARELAGRCANQSATSGYGPQVVMLHRARDYSIRANFWPSADDAAMQDNDPSSFFYGVAHDHNFSFLTAGYMGPGYWSDYYEYDYDTVVGVPGEPVELRYCGRSRLAEGQVMLYRAHRDVHAQLPADSFSVSLNILAQPPCVALRDQYRFDLTAGCIAEVITRAPVEPLLALCAAAGSGNARALVDDFAARHPSDRIRFSAVRALADAEPRIEARAAIYEAAAASSRPFVAGAARRQLATLEAGRTWIERQP